MRTDPNAKLSQQVSSSTKHRSSSVDSDQSDEYEINEDLFDPVPVYVDNNPSAFQMVKKFFRDILGAAADGFSSAWSAIQHAFLGSDNAAAALLHIRQTDTFRASNQPQITSATATLELKSQKNIVSSTENSPVAAVEAVVVPLVDPDEVSFSHYLRGYKADQAKGIETVCPQNFCEGATRHAQNLFDNEVKRCAEFADKPKEYFVAADDQIKIQAAAALLYKKVPHPVPLKFGEIKEVPKHSIDQFANFSAWREWRATGKLPEGEPIDLDAAKKYAESYISEHAKPEYAGNKEVRKVLEEASELVLNFENDETFLLADKITKSLADLKENSVEPKNRKKMSSPPPSNQSLGVGPAPAPPPPRIAANGPPAPHIGANGPPPPPPPPRFPANGPSSSQAPLVGAVGIPTAKAVGIGSGALGLKPADIASPVSALPALPALSSLSAEEVNRATEDFDAYKAAFTKASGEGRNYALLPNSKYLAPACVAIANNFVESIASAQDIQLLEADRNTLLAASFLLSAANQNQKANPQ